VTTAAGWAKLTFGRWPEWHYFKGARSLCGAWGDAWIIGRARLTRGQLGGIVIDDCAGCRRALLRGGR